MTTLRSDQVTVNKSAAAVFGFLSDFNHFKDLMPEQVTNWNSTSDECSFTIAGMASLGMKVTERNPNTLIRAVRHGSAPFDFTLSCHIEDRQEACGVQLVFEADMNPMLKMMAERPLTNFLNMLVQRLQSLSF
jgi:carbon monoxide dehydrogenase subunit G